MRSSKSRSRSKSSRSRSPGNNLNRVFDSSGPEGKVRGTPQQIIDKYTQLARDAGLGNDRVAAENFQQHAEHYTRLLGEAQRDAEARRLQAEQQNRDRQQRERDDRPDRQDRQERGDRSRGGETDPGTAPQPDMPPAVGAPDSGLVETPESAPKKRPPRSRKPKTNPAKGDSGAGSSDAPEAAE